MGGAVLGLVVGALAGVLAPGGKDVPVATEKRPQLLLEQQVAWLHRKPSACRANWRWSAGDGTRRESASGGKRLDDAVPEMPTEYNAPESSSTTPTCRGSICRFPNR